MAKSGAKSVTLDEAFHHELWRWYRNNRVVIRANYPGLAQRFLDYNAPLGYDDELEARRARPRFLRVPQAQALEIYVFLKERMVERSAGGRAVRAWPVHEIFEKWYTKQTPFAAREPIGLTVDLQAPLFDIDFGEAAYKAAFAKMKNAAAGFDYANSIFALTMGTGKTLLMATCIYYDFLMANAYPKDVRYAHNALVFAPDKTVLSTLRRDIEEFDRSLVVPPEYMHVIDAAEARFLEEDGATLTGLRQRFNIIVSNAQKIILKRQAKVPSATARLYAATPRTLEPTSAEARARALFDTQEIENEAELVTNQRYETLRRMKQLGVFIDEAHHAFGKDLVDDMDPEKATSLRRTVDRLAKDLKERGTRVVGCYNFTGTPYANGQIFPEVVYAYGLKMAIDAGYLKEVEVQHIDETKVLEKKFVKDAVADFVHHHGGGRRYEGMLAKLAIFVPKIKDIEPVRRLLLEVLGEAGISGTSVLVNVGDSAHTSTDDIRAFNLLDTPDSDKQFILLVGKGKEGWNCRSLFGVVLYRRPTSRIFVLQAAMRCLRAIDMPPTRTGRVYLSTQCKAMLDQELHENYKLTVDELKKDGPSKQRVEVRPVRPIPRLEVRRKRHLWELKVVAAPSALDLDFSAELVERYRVLRTIQTGLRGDGREVTTRFEAVDMEDREHSRMTVVAEIARYLNRSPIAIEDVFEKTPDLLDLVVEWVSRHNELLHDYVIPTVFRALYTLEAWEKEVVSSIALVREPPGQPPDDCYVVHALPEMIRAASDHAEGTRSFHVDHYCFDSKPELQFFVDAVSASDDISEVYFTGMLTHGQTDFYVDYIDPYQHSLRHYYPDFVVRLKNGNWLVVEVKGDNKLEDPIVEAKARFARELADSSRMVYRVVPASEVNAGRSLLALGLGKDTRSPVLPFSPRRPFQSTVPRHQDKWVTSVPLVSLRAAAGDWSDEQWPLEDSLKEANEWVTFQPSRGGRFEPGMFVAQVSGRSMEPEIPDGSYCLFRSAGMGAGDGARVLAWLQGTTDTETGGAYTVKVLHRIERKVGRTKKVVTELRPLNASFQPLVIEDADHVRVLATLVEVLGPSHVEADP